jgi:hypothetical protein
MTFDIPNKDGLWVFHGNALTAGTAFQTWVKPTQYNNFIFYVCGGGGAGGAGSGAGSGNRGGGGGGAGGTLTVLNTPSYLLPETLYLSVGCGGQTNQSAGIVTYINYYPNTNAANIIVSSAGGGGGLGGVAGTGGAGSAISINQSIFSIGGNNGCSGSSGGLTGSNFSITTSCVYGGTGGGGVDASNVANAGGNILASNIHPQLDGGAVASAGKAGYLIKKPFTALGGTGGGGNNLSVGGRGGDGIYGSGGGGGGGGTSAGQGGKGGNGFVIIIGY